MGKQDILDLLRSTHPRKLSRAQIAEALNTTPNKITGPLRRLQMDRDITALMENGKSRGGHIKYWGLRPK